MLPGSAPAAPSLGNQVTIEAFEAEKKSEAEVLLSKTRKDERVKQAVFEVLSETSLEQVSQEISSSRRKLMR